jgi:hypothetical protein
MGLQMGLVSVNIAYKIVLQPAGNTLSNVIESAWIRIDNKGIPAYPQRK